MDLRAQDRIRSDHDVELVYKVTPIQQLAVGPTRQIRVNVVGPLSRLTGISGRRSLAPALALSFYLGFTGSLQFALVFCSYLCDTLFFAGGVADRDFDLGPSFVDEDFQGGRMCTQLVAPL